MQPGVSSRAFIVKDNYVLSIRRAKNDFIKMREALATVAEAGWVYSHVVLANFKSLVYFRLVKRQIF